MKPDDSMAIYNRQYEKAFFFTKPLYNCMACMGSIYGLFAALWVGLDKWEVVLFIIALSGLNAVIDKIVN